MISREVIEETEIDSYVDDTKLYLSISLKDIQVGLSHISEDLKRVAEWCCSNSFLINPKKTKFILFGVPQNLHRLPNISVEFIGQQLKPVASCKVVGILLDSGLTFNEHWHTSNPMFQVFNQYMRMVRKCCLSVLCAQETGPSTWDHLKCLKYFFVDDRLNYVRMSPVYLAEIKTLPDTDPDIYQ